MTQEDIYRKYIAKVLLDDKTSVVDALNKNGFPTSYSVPNNDLTVSSLKALLISNSFKKAMNDLIIKNYSSQLTADIKAVSSKKNFADQPEVMSIVNANNMITDVSSINHGFVANHIFDNHTQRQVFNFNSNEKVFKNFSVDEIDLGGFLTTAANTYTGVMQAQAQDSTAAAAVQLEQLKIQQQQAAAAAAAQSNAGFVATVKAYETPIITVGILSIVGIAAYFYFKKKKIS